MCLLESKDTLANVSSAEHERQLSQKTICQQSHLIKDRLFRFAAAYNKKVIFESG